MNGFLYNGQRVPDTLATLLTLHCLDSLDCRYKQSMFIGYVNKLINSHLVIYNHIY